MSKNFSKFEGSTSQALLDIGKDIGEIKTMLQKQDNRISGLEKWRWLLTGGLIVLASSNFSGLTRLLGL